MFAANITKFSPLQARHNSLQLSDAIGTAATPVDKQTDSGLASIPSLAESMMWEQWTIATQRDA